MKRRASSRSTSPPPTHAAAEGPTLPPWKAFVVQFSKETCAGGKVFSGRVEHLNSGRRARFASPKDLVAALEHLLGDLGEEQK